MEEKMEFHELEKLPFRAGSQEVNPLIGISSKYCAFKRHVRGKKIISEAWEN